MYKRAEIFSNKWKPKCIKLVVRGRYDFSSLPFERVKRTRLNNAGK